MLHYIHWEAAVYGLTESMHNLDCSISQVRFGANAYGEINWAIIPQGPTICYSSNYQNVVRQLESLTLYYGG